MAPCRVAASLMASSVPTLILLMLWTPQALSEDGTPQGVPVYLSNVALSTTHDLPLTTPEVYFQCEGEPKKYLTGVAEARTLYNFSFHESFQPLTVLEVPKCKRCGLYEQDFFTEDDTFFKFELCPLDFSEPPEGRLFWSAPREANLTFFCQRCNSHNAVSGGVVFEPATATNTSYLLIFSIVLGSALGLSTLVVLIAYCVKEELWRFRRHTTDDAKFMAVFDGEEDDFLDEDGLDVEMADHNRIGKRDD